jgi:hypothetical protein
MNHRWLLGLLCVLALSLVACDRAAERQARSEEDHGVRTSTPTMGGVAQAAPSPAPTIPAAPVPSPSPQTVVAVPGCGTGGIVQNLDIPENGSCTITEAVILGTIRLRRGATLVIVRGELAGTIVAEDASALRIEGTRIIGTITASRAGEVAITGTEVAGTISLQGNRGTVSIRDNTIVGTVQIDGGMVQCESNRTIGTLRGCP